MVVEFSAFVSHFYMQNKMDDVTVCDTPVDVVKLFVSNFERKQRNLVKRKAKLDQYRERLTLGETLDEGQKRAVEGYDGVLQNILMLQEIINHSKELVESVEKSSEIMESKTELACERRILSFLPTQLCLMRLLQSLDSHQTRLAIEKASSDNHLRLLDILRSLITPPVIDGWSGMNSFNLENSLSLCQNDKNLRSAALHAYNFVTGRPVPIPIPENYDGQTKRLNFKEARTLCLRLLATPDVRRSMLPVATTGSSLEVYPSSVDEVKDVYATAPIGHSLATSQQSHLERFDELQRAPEELTEIGHLCLARMDDVEHTSTAPSQIIKPPVSSFKFIQASHVISSDARNDAHTALSSPELINIPCSDYGLAVSQTDEVPEFESGVPADCYIPEPDITQGVFFDVSERDFLNSPPHINPPEAEPNQMESSKPVSYADLVRRMSHIHIESRNHSTVDKISEPRIEQKIISTSVIESGDLKEVSGSNNPGSYFPGPSRGRGMREFRDGRRPSRLRSNFMGPPRRAMGGRPRFGSINRGGGMSLRGAHVGVAQSSY